MVLFTGEFFLLDNKNMSFYIGFNCSNDINSTLSSVLEPVRCQTNPEYVDYGWRRLHRFEIDGHSIHCCSMRDIGFAFKQIIVENRGLDILMCQVALLEQKQEEEEGKKSCITKMPSPLICKNGTMHPFSSCKWNLDIDTNEGGEGGKTMCLRVMTKYRAAYLLPKDLSVISANTARNINARLASLDTAGTATTMTQAIKHRKPPMRKTKKRKASIRRKPAQRLSSSSSSQDSEKEEESDDNVSDFEQTDDELQSRKRKHVGDGRVTNNKRTKLIDEAIDLMHERTSVIKTHNAVTQKYLEQSCQNLATIFNIIQKQ